ncbi:MAG: phospholipid carrier-dependent glycosyltransferase [Gemmatimonadetes bacterium]|nr:phospholipid carrier-dependent glycosyltransferase [Gemmatimonadota bacterium]
MLLLGGVSLVSTTVVWTAANPLPHPGGDNAGYIALAHGLLTNGTYTDIFDPEALPHTKYPPVFPALLALLIALGARTWVALKSVAAVATVVSVAFAYLWAESVLKPLGAFAVALLVAVSAGVVYYSQWVLSDPVFLAFTMMALYALARADRSGRTEGGVDEGSKVGVGAEGRVLDPRWLAFGIVATGLAYFTRSAGLPLVLALFAWLAVRRAWRPLGAASIALGLPLAAWWVRARSVQGVAQYASEFWMVNPYDPSLGTVGIGGLVGRVAENAVGYTTAHLPVGVVGGDAPAATAVGVALVGAACAGWFIRVREELGPAELFFPLYWGVVLLWPTVWSGDRFALPLLPLAFAYGAVAFRTATRRVPEAAVPVVGTVLVLALLLPAADAWRRATETSSACPADVRARDVWGCYGPGVQSFMAAAAWSGDGLPDGERVLSRKPRHYYLQSGVPSRAFAFFEEPAAHLELADALAARYILLDQWDGFARRYVASAVTRRPGAFCFVRGFGSAANGGSQLLGVLPPTVRETTDAVGGDVRLESCPGEYMAEPMAPADDYSSSGLIPLLEGPDS